MSNCFLRCLHKGTPLACSLACASGVEGRSLIVDLAPNLGCKVTSFSMGALSGQAICISEEGGASVLIMSLAWTARQLSVVRMPCRGMVRLEVPLFLLLVLLVLHLQWPFAYRETSSFEGS